MILGLLVTVGLLLSSEQLQSDPYALVLLPLSMTCSPLTWNLYFSTLFQGKGKWANVT